MSGQGTVDVSYNGRHLTTVDVSGHPEALHAFLGYGAAVGAAAR